MWINLARDQQSKKSKEILSNFYISQELNIKVFAGICKISQL